MNTPNDRYVPPAMYNSESTFVPTTPEVDENHEWGNFVRSIEHSIESFRQQADETTIEKYENKGRLQKLAAKAFKVPRSKEQIINELINIEAFAGGKMLPRGANVTSQMFWYGDQDWFYQISELTKANGPTASTVRFQARYDQLMKSADGTLVSLGEGEKKAFTTWIQQYHALLANKIYPGLNDTMIDDQLDYLMDDVDDELSHRKKRNHFNHGPRNDYDLAA